MEPVYVDNLSTATLAMLEAIRDANKLDPLAKVVVPDESQLQTIMISEMITRLLICLGSPVFEFVYMARYMKGDACKLTGGGCQSMTRERAKALLWDGLALWDMTPWHDNLKPTN